METTTQTLTDLFVNEQETLGWAPGEQEKARKGLRRHKDRLDQLEERVAKLEMAADALAAYSRKPQMETDDL